MKLVTTLRTVPLVVVVVLAGCSGADELAPPPAGDPWPDDFVRVDPDASVVAGCIGFSAEQVIARVAARRLGWELAVLLGGPDALAARLECVSGKQTWPAPPEEVRAWLEGPPFPADLSESVRASLEALAAEQREALARNERRYLPPEVAAHASRGDDALARARQVWIDAMRQRTPVGMGGLAQPEGKLAPAPTTEGLLAGEPRPLEARLIEALGPRDGVQVIDAPVGQTQAVGRLRLGLMLGERTGLILNGLELPRPLDAPVQVDLARSRAVTVTLRAGPALEAAHVLLTGPAVPWPPGSPEPVPGHTEERARAGDLLVVPLEGNRARVAARGLVFDSRYVGSFGPVEVELDQPAPP